MLIDLVTAWKNFVQPTILSENEEIKALDVAQSSFQFDISPHIMFVSNITTRENAIYYGDLPSVGLQPEEQKIYDQTLEQQQKKTHFYNGKQILLTGAVYDTSKNTLYLEAVRVDYLFLVALQKMKAINASGSKLQQKDFFKTGVMAPFIANDNKVCLVTRKDKLNLRSVASGFLECESETDDLTKLILLTATKEADEEFAFDHTGKRRFDFVGIPAITSISFRDGLGIGTTPTIEFIVPMRLKQSASFILSVMNNNESCHAYEHVPGSAISVPVAADERQTASHFIDQNLPGSFLYGPVLHACASKIHQEMPLASRISGISTSRFFPIGIFKPTLSKAILEPNRTHCFRIKGQDSIGVIELVRNPNHINKEAASAILVESFITEYEKYLTPNDISHNLTSWREGNNSVKLYYEEYFKTELDDFYRGDLHYWAQVTIQGQLAGWATFQREQSDQHAVYMNLLVVHPAYQNRGVGGQLVYALANLHAIQDISAINLLLRKKNRGGRIFYSKLGFNSDSEYQRNDNFVDRDLLEGFTWKNPSLQKNFGFSALPHKTCSK